MSTPSPATRLSPQSTPGGFPYRQFPHPFPGGNPDRQAVGDPGHCEDCVSVGHVIAHPDRGCGDVGCTRAHGPDDEPPPPGHPSTPVDRPRPAATRRGEQARRTGELTALAALTAPATYRAGDYVTFVLVANVTATVQVIELTADGETRYAFSNGQIGAFSDHRVLTLWRPASPAEIALFTAHAVDRLGETIALPHGGQG